MNVFVSGDASELTMMYGSWNHITNADALATIRTRWQSPGTAEAGYRVMFIFTGGVSPSQWGRDPYLTLTHEYFHIVQDDLVGSSIANAALTTPPTQVRAWGPAWLVEGSADLFGWLAYSERSGRSFDGIKADQIAQARTTTDLLQLMETNRGFQSVATPYQLAFLATDLLSKPNGVGSLAQYFTSIGEGAEWHAAFQAAFGISADAFYTKFQQYRSNGFR